jgi:hypothetical protein
MKINPNRLNPGTWFPYKEDTKVKVRMMTDDKQRLLRAKCTVDDKFDENKYNEEMMDYCIVDWEGFIDEATGEPLRLTKELKMSCLVEEPEFNIFFLKAIDSIIKGLKVKAEEFEKNFSGS